MTNNLNFADRLNLILDENDIPPKQHGRQKIIAEMFGVSQTSTWKWLSGDGLPDLKKVIEIAQRFNVDVEWLLYGKQHRYQFTRLSKGQESISLPAPPIAVPILDDAMIRDPKCSTEAAYKNREFILFDSRYVSISQNTFAYVNKNNRMSPTLQTNDLLIVDPDTSPQPGNLIMVKLDKNNELIIGKYRELNRATDGKITVDIVAENPDWLSHTIHPDDHAKIIGVIVEYRRRSFQSPL